MTAGETPGIDIRHASRRDLDLTEAIENEADELLIALLRPQSWRPAPTGRERGAQRGFTLMAVETGTDRRIGFVHVLEVGDLAHLEQLSVLPDSTRRGVGRRLVEAAAAEAQHRGHDRITLRTFADVPFNAPFYETCGFVETEPDTEFHRGLVGAEQDHGLSTSERRIQMTRRLDAAQTG
ncbi:GNAT family N-acetyltransferase [Agromyces sp. Leaf222]|uniref:GNAT family N-acetyltransferase n=1 Tax=Agromyces sp. Leaf222 TaxID=1735688 RepID=UPI0006F7717B|nr:GNAT family N-acetyltransferase [Agromyces sp. Leaf222]KQM83109.1 hypothetical protein ASE68_07545 [Agromyces sp. Leaf222]